MWSSRLRQVDALLPCANPCARTSACLPRRVLRALLLLRELDSPFHLCAQPLHRHLASQPRAALWRLGLEQLLCVLPRAQKCVATVSLCASPAHLHPCTPLLAYIDTKPHHPPSSVPMRCPSSMHCFAALIRHKSCLAMPPRGRIVTYPCPRLVDYMLYRVPAARVTRCTDPPFCAPPCLKVCGDCTLVCLARPPSPVHSSALLAYIDTKPHHPPSSVRCPSSMHCLAMSPSFATSCALLYSRAGES
jgi:hypothetical protein